MRNDERAISVYRKVRHLIRQYEMRAFFKLGRLAFTDDGAASFCDAAQHKRSVLGHFRRPADIPFVYRKIFSLHKGFDGDAFSRFS